MVRLIVVEKVISISNKRCFNSKMVRLIENLKGIIKMKLVFQFQNGSINRVLKATMAELNLKFQFQNGSINRR